MGTTAVEYLKGELARKLAHAQSVVMKCEAEGRSPSAEERDEVQKEMTEVKDLRAKVEEMEANQQLVDTVRQMQEIMSTPATEEAKEGQHSIGQAFIASDQYKALRLRGFGGEWRSGTVEIQFPKKRFGSKAFGDVPGGGVTSLADGTNAVLPDISTELTTQDVIFLGDVARLFGQGTLERSSYTYLQAAGDPASGSAHSVAEGANKPPSEIQLTSVNEPVVKIATFLPVSEEAMEDIPGLVSFLDAQLALYVRGEEEDQLLNGAGSPDLSGILDRAISTAAAGDIGGTNSFDAVMAGITKCRVDGGLDPDAVIMNPTDYAQMLIATPTNGPYYSGGPFASVGQPNPWGVRLVLTQKMAAGHAIVGAFRQGAQLFRKGGLTVEASNSHSDWFRKNIVAIRAETRICLAVYRPKAFADVTLP